MNKHNQNKKGKKIIATNNKKTHILVPIIAMLILISLITTIVVGIHLTNNSKQQIAGVENEEEEIKAAEATIVNPGSSYVAPMRGYYRIELHGGQGKGFSKEISGSQGDKVVLRYVFMDKNDSFRVVSTNHTPALSEEESARGIRGGHRYRTSTRTQW